MTKRYFVWTGWFVVICGGVAACSGADVSSPEEVTASAQDELRGPKFCGGARGVECAEDQYCKARAGHCPDEKHGGRCVDRPEVCTKEYQPVCGCDGVTYGNRCMAAAAGVSVDHRGSCVEDPGSFCGGIAGFPCPDGQTCVDDPSDDCDPQNGGADCGGICVDDGGAFCGGIAGFPCPQGQTCVDDPDDDCDPQNGGADCGGVCVDGAPCGAATCGPGLECCNPVMGICTTPGGVCIQ